MSICKQALSLSLSGHIATCRRLLAQTVSIVMTDADTVTVISTEFFAGNRSALLHL